MKKLLMTFLLSLSCACTLAAVACTTGENSSSSSPDSSSSSSERGPADLTVTFAEGEGYSIVSDFSSGDKVASGDVVEFTVKVNPFYTGYPVVYAGEEAIAPVDDNGLYSVVVTESVDITVANIKKDVSNMVGSGSFDDAFVVSKPIDLLYIAEQVNAGKYEYVTGAYVLANDIDCGGEELQIIGDMSTPDSYFSGCFTCLTDSETGAMERYTISNFTINSNNVNYVGLFGTVYADLSVTSSGLFYGIRLENFEINARVDSGAKLDSRSISAGGLIGYAVGANLYLCDAVNGSININGDDSYFSFAGGLVGYQYGFYLADYDTSFPSEIVYSTADVDVRILNGMGLAAGGIAGYVSSNHPYGAAAFIHNSYATGNVSGAIRSGGIAGILGQYSSVSNCYASGRVSATSTQSASNLLLTSDEYCYANAGGIAGFAENDTIVNDCFFAGRVSASAVSGKAYASSANDIGGGYEAGTTAASAQKYLSDNCHFITAEEITSKTYLNEKLGWGEYDWAFTVGQLPTINYGAPDSLIQKTVTLHYVAKDTEGKTVEVTLDGAAKSDPLSYFDTSTQSSNVYAPMGTYFASGGLEIYLEADNGYLSYGYFFDEACTRKVPLSYVPQKNIDLYIGFADPTPIVGTYYFVYGNNTDPLTITFSKNGIATYTDGSTSQQANFLYDGETVIVESARLARYYLGAIEEDTTTDDSVLVDANFEIARYAFYDFAGTLTDGVLSLYDGVYFTKETPLVAYLDGEEFLRGTYHFNGNAYAFYGNTATVSGSNAVYTYTVSNGTVTLSANGQTDIALTIADLNELDPFYGTWTKSATVTKTYAFNGMGGWTYEYGSNQASGTYTVNDDVMSFTHNGVDYTAILDENGFLQIRNDENRQTYYAENSYVGTWVAQGMTVRLYGINANGSGRALVEFSDESQSEFIYERSETNGYVCLYYTDSTGAKGTVFGYFTYDETTKYLNATFTDLTLTAANGYNQLLLAVIDDYNGEWICDAEEFLNVEFDFNGYGLYQFFYGTAGQTGKLTLTKDGETETVDYTLTDILEGEFYYDGKKYTISYNEDTHAVTLRDTSVNSDAMLERKDELADAEFIDLSGNTYLFDGKSNLSIGGTAIINGTAEYKYVVTENGWTVLDGENTFATLTKTNGYYLFEPASGTAQQLHVKNKFMGDWAISGTFDTFSIGPTDLNGKIKAAFKGYNVEITQLNATTLRFSYKENRMPITYFVYVFKDEIANSDILVLTETEGMFTEYTVCTRANEFYGTWTNKDGWTITFDGITSGSYSNGLAYLSRNGNTASGTPYYYFVRENGVMMSSQTLLGDKTLYYKLELLTTVTDADRNDKNVYVNGDRAIKRTEVDGLYLSNAVHTDEDGNKTTYFFDGEGNMLVDGETVYTYVIKSYNTDSTATLHITKDGVTYMATMDYSDSNNITLKIGDIVTDEEIPEENETV